MSRKIVPYLIFAGWLFGGGALAGDGGKALAADEGEHDEVGATAGAQETSDGIIEFSLDESRHPTAAGDRAPAILTRSQLLRDLQAFYEELSQLGVSQQRATGEYAACDIGQSDDAGLTNYFICLQSLGSPRRGQGP